MLSDPTSSDDKVVPTQQPVKRHSFKIFGKTFTALIWLFSFFVLLNMEPVTKMIDTLSRFDSFLRYARAEDDEFGKDVNSKYIRLKESFINVKISAFKTLAVIGEQFEVPWQVFQSVFDEGYHLVADIGSGVQQYLFAEEKHKIE